MAGINVGPSMQRMGMMQRGNMGRMGGGMQRPMPRPPMMGESGGSPGTVSPLPRPGVPMPNPGYGGWGGIGGPLMPPGGMVRPPFGGRMMGPQGIPPNGPMPNITGNSPTQDSGFWNKYNKLSSMQQPSGGGGVSGGFRY